MPRRATFSAQTLAILAVLATEPSAWREHGYDLASETGLKSGTLYPILVRLADRNIVEACWEQGQPASGAVLLLPRVAGGLAAWPGGLAGQVANPQLRGCARQALTGPALDGRTMAGLARDGAPSITGTGSRCSLRPAGVRLVAQRHRRRLGG